MKLTTQTLMFLQANISYNPAPLPPKKKKRHVSFMRQIKTCKPYKIYGHSPLVSTEAATGGVL